MIEIGENLGMVLIAFGVIFGICFVAWLSYRKEER